MQVLYAIRSFIFVEGIHSFMKEEVRQLTNPTVCPVEVEAILHLVTTRKYDLLFVDMDCLGIASDALFKQLKDSFPTLKVVAIAEQLDRKILKAYRKGIVASFSKNETKEHVTLAIQAILSNQVYVPNSIIMGMISEGHVFTDIETQLKLLSTKEIQVLEHLSGGSRMKEVSQQMKIAPSTLSTHKLRIMKKLSLENRRALVNFIAAYLDWKKNNPTS